MQLLRGSVYSIIYNGGQNPGSRRIVYVLHNDNVLTSPIQVYCFNRQGIRNLDRSKIGQNPSKVVFHRLPLKELPSTIGVDEVINGFKADGCHAYFDSNIQTIISFPKQKYSHSSDSHSITFYSDTGSLNLYTGHNVSMSKFDKDGSLLQTYNSPTTQQIVDSVAEYSDAP